MGWGGARPNSGPQAVKGPSRRKKPGQALAVAPAQAKGTEPSPFLADMIRALPSILATSGRGGRNVRTAENNPFKLPSFPDRAKPKAGLMAMDDNMAWASNNWTTGAIFNGIAAEGLAFPGYAYLSELAQRAEYRILSETIADDATRKWIKFEVTGDGDPKAKQRRADAGDDPDEGAKRIKAAGKDDKVKQLNDFLAELEARDHFYALCRDEGYFGRMHLYLGIGDRDPGAADAELKTSIGNGRDSVSLGKINPDQPLTHIRTIEPVWTYPQAYNAINPLRRDWYNPQQWYVMGTEVHCSRIIPIVSRPVPDMLKPAYSFGGLSTSQIAEPYVNIWLQMRQNVADLVKSFSVMVLSTNMGTQLQAGSAQTLNARAAIFNALRDNMGLMIVDKSTEDFKNVSASLAGLDSLQAQAQEHVAAIARIPLVKYTGLQPKGLNASSEGEIAVYDDTIGAYQNRTIRPPLARVINFAQLSLWGEIDPGITFEFEKLREISQKEEGENQKAEGERDQIYVDMGTLAPGEVRRRIVNDPDLPYADLDPEDVPDLMEEEEEGLAPKGGGGAVAAELGGAENDNNPKGKEAAGQDAVIPFGLGSDADFNEGDHPRAPNGEFGAGSGGKSSKTAGRGARAESASKPAPLKPSDIKQVGKQMGSNPGGVFEDKTGQKFYVKQGQSKDHVRNELLAASLYQLAGAPTLKYRDVEGGGHIATEMQKLDKKRVHDFSPAERKQAQADLAVHAWLANWDAVGLEGDNQGTIAGRPTSLDLGGALTYRAQGAPKGSAFGTKVGELDTLRNAQMNPVAAKVFGDMKPEEIKESVSKVASIPDAKINAAVKQAGLDQALADKLIARKKDMAARFGLAGDQAGRIIEIEPDVFAMDEAGFEESRHPRDKGGQFASAPGGGGGASTAIAGNAPGAGETPKEFKSKKDHVAHLLLNGTTAAEILKATGWPSVSVPAQAKAAGMKLEKFKEGGVTKYKGVPMTKEEITAAKAEAKTTAAAKKEESQYPPDWKPAATPAPAAAPKKSAAQIDIENVKKFSPKFAAEVAKIDAAMPGDGTVFTAKAKVKAAVLSGDATDSALKVMLKPEEVNVLKKMYGSVEAAYAKSQAYAEKDKAAAVAAEKQKEANAVAAEAQKKANAAAAEKLKQAKEAAAAKNKEYMAALGISETEAVGFGALAQMIGGKADDLVAKFKGYEQQAKDLNYPISGFQYALIRNYINGGYIQINEALRSASMTAAQHVYARMVNNALDKLPKYEGTVTRGATLPANVLARYKPGQVVMEHGFTSSGIDYKFGGSVHYTIKANGMRGADFSKGANKSEREVLFKSNTPFLVHKVETKNGTTYIEMEEVEHHG